MRKRAIFVASALITLFSLSASAQTPHLPFTDNFLRYQTGSDGSPAWHPVKGNWHVAGGAYIQQAGDYDCASFLPFNLNQSFELEVTFEQLDGDIGAGVVFSSSRRDDASFAQLARFDGGTTFIMGYYQNGDYNGTASVKSPPVTVGSRHRLTLRVDRDREEFEVLLDGKTLQSHVPLVYPSGYCGLQSSGGRIAFRSVRLRALPMHTRPPDLSWVKRFALTRDERIVVPDEERGTVGIFDLKGMRTREIGRHDGTAGMLDQPDAVALLDDSTLAVADRGKERLSLFTLDGRWKASAGWKGKERGQLDEPVAIAVGPHRQLFVLEKNNNRVQVFDDSLRSIGEFGADRLKQPLDLAVRDSNVFVVNTGLSQVEQYVWTGKSARRVRFIGYGGGQGRGIAVRDSTVYLSVVNEVRAYDLRGRLLHTLSARCVDFMIPWSLHFAPDGSICVADFFGSRILITTGDLLDPVPGATFAEVSSPIIRWRSSMPGPGRLLLTRGGDTVATLNDPGNASTHEIRLHNVQPGVTYRIQVSPTLGAIPPREKPSRFFPLAVPPGNGMKTYARLPMAALIFTDVQDAAASRPGIPPPAAVSDSEVARIKAQLADAVRFYWIHSGMRLFLDLETIVVKQRFERSALYGDEWWYPPRDSTLESVLKMNGKDLHNYSAFLYLTCSQQFDTALGKYILAGKGGAFTNGVGTGKGYGISWWDVTKANHNAGNNWLMVHEFNHQLDDIFMVSGYPEYWFNHISPTIGTAAKFGEHFDANAYIMHIVPADEWADLRYTQLRTARDADGDGIPDNDPALPLDEVRLGSDTTKTDTDGDGVSDFDELFFSNWIANGWGETAGNPILPNLHEKDTDHDGLDDHSDPYPCFPFKPEIPAGSPHTGTDLRSPGWHPFASVHDRRINAETFAAWDRDSLYVGFRMDRTEPVKVMLDGSDDGWFLGRENYLLTLTPSGDSAVVAKLQIQNATDPDQWPFMDHSLSDTIRVRCSIVRKGEGVEIEASVPRNDASGFTLEQGRTIGLLVGFLSPFDGDGNKRYVDLFEPNRFLDVTLTANP